MQDIEQTSTQSLIDQYYQEEQNRRLQEKTQADLLIRVNPADLAMINMIARRFQKNREELVSDVMSSALIDLFSQLEAGERKLLARDADESTRQLAQEIAEENGVMDIEVPQGQWVNTEKQLVKAEKKRQRDQEKQQQMLDTARELIARMEQEEQTAAQKGDSTSSEASSDKSTLPASASDKGRADSSATVTGETAADTPADADSSVNTTNQDDSQSENAAALPDNESSPKSVF